MSLIAARSLHSRRPWQGDVMVRRYSKAEHQASGMMWHVFPRVGGGSTRARNVHNAALIHYLDFMDTFLSPGGG
jgi:2-methylcitrate dehydratase PrpD